MKYKIEATIEQRTVLAKIFATSLRNVYYALNYERHSELAMRIRQAALRMGCKKYEVEITMTKREVESPEELIKVLDARGNVVRVVNE